MISGLAGAAVGLIRSPLWQSKGATDARGADGHARCARDSSAESLVGIDARDRRRLGLARSTVRETLKRAQTAGLAWPLPEGMNDEALEAALYARQHSKRDHRRIEEPDWASVHRELKRKHVTL